MGDSRKKLRSTEAGSASALIYAIDGVQRRAMLRHLHDVEEPAGLADVGRALGFPAKVIAYNASVLEACGATRKESKLRRGEASEHLHFSQVRGNAAIVKLLEETKEDDERLLAKMRRRQERRG